MKLPSPPQCFWLTSRVFLCLIIASLPTVILAQENAEKKPDEAKAEVKVEPPVELKTESGKIIAQVLEGLNNPTGLAIQPETGILYVADSGNGQIVRLAENKFEPVITDFPKELLGTTPPMNIGPLSLAFSGKDMLIVTTGGQPAGEDTVRSYTLPAQPAAAKYDTSTAALSLPAVEGTNVAEGNFFGLGLSLNAIYTTSQGDGNKGWLNVATLKPTEGIETLVRHIPTVESVGTPMPTAITVTPHGYVLVGSLGGLGPEKDSVAAFFEPGSKKMIMKLELGLHDVTAIAYSARRQMYVLDMAWSQPEGGLYRIIEDKSVPSGLRTKLIAKLPHPTAMCFDSEGALNITLRGKLDDKGNSQGSLVRIPSDENL